MSYAKVETSVPRHPKFLRAGAPASWLWLCGVCYCQEALTDGFIAREAVSMLGVEKPLPLAAKLVQVGLWDVVEGGWQIHDYLKHNNSADYIRKVQEERRVAGRRGGRGRRHTDSETVNLFAFSLLQREVKQTVNPSVPVSVPVQNEKQERADAYPHPVENRPRPELVRHHRRRRSRETQTGQPAVNVMTALARHVVRMNPHEHDEGELRELLKEACSKANLRYDGKSIGAALEAAMAQLRRTA